MERLRKSEQERFAPLTALLRVMNIQGVSVNEGTLASYEQMRELYTDAILLLAGQACAKAGGKLDDVMTTLRAWKRMGLQNAAQVRESLKQVEQQNAFLGALYELWGRPHRPSAGDRALVNRWERELGFGEETILFSAAFARDADKPMPYLDKLLTAYHAQGRCV